MRPLQSQLQEEYKDTTIEPKDIDTTDYMYGVLGQLYNEAIAWFVVKLCQKKEGWVRFTKKELSELTKSVCKFESLDEDHGYFVKQGNEYQVTDYFVHRCYKFAPVEKGEENDSIN